MSVSLEKTRNSYLPKFYKKDVPIIRLVEEEEEEEEGVDQEIGQHREVIIPKTKRVLRWLSSMVLTETQKERAENTIPIAIPIIVFIGILSYSRYVLRHYNYRELPNDFSTICMLLTTIIIGIPLEIAHGTRIICYLVSLTMLHANLLQYYFYGRGTIIERTYSYDEKPVNLSLLALHMTNIYMNWREMNHKVVRLFVIFILLIPNHISIWIYYYLDHRYLHPINILFFICSMNGISFGYYWIYGTKKPILKYAMTIITLIVIVILLFRDGMFTF